MPARIENARFFPSPDAGMAGYLRDEGRNLPLLGNVGLSDQVPRRIRAYYFLQ